VVALAPEVVETALVMVLMSVLQSSGG
jgi:hypothetical protein